MPVYFYFILGMRVQMLDEFFLFGLQILSSFIMFCLIRLIVFGFISFPPKYLYLEFGLAFTFVGEGKGGYCVPLDKTEGSDQRNVHET